MTSGRLDRIPKGARSHSGPLKQRHLTAAELKSSAHAPTLHRQPCDAAPEARLPSSRKFARWPPTPRSHLDRVEGSLSQGRPPTPRRTHRG